MHHDALVAQIADANVDDGPEHHPDQWSRRRELLPRFAKVSIEVPASSSPNGCHSPTCSTRDSSHVPFFRAPAGTRLSLKATGGGAEGAKPRSASIPNDAA